MATEKTRTRSGQPAVTMADFASEIRDLEGSSESINIMLYSDSGVGKTWIAGTLPNNLILACEPGYISAARAPLAATKVRRKVRVIPDTATMLAGLNWLEGGGYEGWDWITLEGGTTLQTKALLGYAAEAFDANPAKRSHRNLPDKPDYYNAQNFMKSTIARLIDLPVNVLFTAHPMRTYDDDGERLVLPGIQGKGTEVSNYVSGLMHVVGYMRPCMIKEGRQKGEQVRRMIFQTAIDPETDTTYFAKDQYDALPTYLDNPSMPDILSYIEPVAKGSGKKPVQKTTRRPARRAA